MTVTTQHESTRRAPGKGVRIVRLGCLVFLLAGVTAVLVAVVWLGILFVTEPEEDYFGGEPLRGTWPAPVATIALQGELVLSSATARQTTGEGCTGNDDVLGIVADDGKRPMTVLTLARGEPRPDGGCVFTFSSSVPVATTYRFQIYGPRDDGAGNYHMELGVFDREDLEGTEASGTPALRLRLES
jgi:hypothetical protein